MANYECRIQIIDGRKWRPVGETTPKAAADNYAWHVITEGRWPSGDHQLIVEVKSSRSTHQFMVQPGIRSKKV